MKLHEFEAFGLKKDQRVKIYCHYNGKQTLFAKGRIDSIKKRKNRRILDKLSEKEYYKLKLTMDEYDYHNDCGEAEVDSFQISKIEKV